MRVELTSVGGHAVDVITKPEEPVICESISAQNLTMTVAEAIELHKKLGEVLNIGGDQC